jgi:hypothetical protein
MWIQILLGSCSLATVVLGAYASYTWLRTELQSPYAPPLPGIAPRVYRSLERARTRLFGRNRQVRFTIFVVDPDDPSHLRPMARLGSGRPARNSKVRFKRGEGLAGKAWAQDALMVATLGPFKSKDEARRANREIFDLSEETANSLSDDQTEMKTIIAVPLHFGRAIKGVLCIDCLDKIKLNDPATKKLWLGIFRLATEVANRIDFNPQISDHSVGSIQGASLWEVKAA